MHKQTLNPEDAEAQLPDQAHIGRTGSSAGTLYVVATPIGNLSDLSQRAADTLRAVRWVAAEDTRVSRVLLDRISASTAMISVHQHNEQASATRLLERLQAGEDIALITDAGTPAISDPGSAIVAAARAQGFVVVPIPGASAPITLLSAAGLPPSPFLFEGFLPPKEKARLTRLAELRRSADAIGAHVVLFEAPHRIERTLAAIAQSHGERRVVVIGRELTKKFEEIHRCEAAAAVSWLDERTERRRGEFVIAIAALERAPRSDEGDSQSNDADTPGEGLESGLGAWPAAASGLAEPAALMKRLLQDMPPSRAVRLAEELTGIGHRELYALALSLKNEAS